LPSHSIDSLTTPLSTLSLHDALPISPALPPFQHEGRSYIQIAWPNALLTDSKGSLRGYAMPLADLSRAAQLEALLNRKTRQAYRSEEHTSELQSRETLVCRLLLEKKI